ncbi:MAG: hypothetical protein AAB477_01460 [Patescibacteria group bacterium]
MGKQMRKGDCFFMDSTTPTEEIRDLIRYLLLECRDGCDWKLAKFLLQKEDFLIEDFFLLFRYFDGINFGDELNKDILSWAKTTWGKLKLRGLSSEELIMFTRFYFIDIASDAWDLLKKRDLDKKSLLSIIIYCKHSQAEHAFKEIGNSIDETNLTSEEISYLFHRIVSDTTPEGLRILYFHLFKKQDRVIKKFGNTTLRCVCLKSYNSQPNIYFIISTSNGGMITCPGIRYPTWSHINPDGLSADRILQSPIVAS